MQKKNPAYRNTESLDRCGQQHQYFVSAGIKKGADSIFWPNFFRSVLANQAMYYIDQDDASQRGFHANKPDTLLIMMEVSLLIQPDTTFIDFFQTEASTFDNNNISCKTAQNSIKCKSI